MKKQLDIFLREKRSILGSCYFYEVDRFFVGRIWRILNASSLRCEITNFTLAMSAWNSKNLENFACQKGNPHEWNLGTLAKEREFWILHPIITSDNMLKLIGVLCNHQEVVVVMFSKIVGVTEFNAAEAVAILKALQIYLLSFQEKVDNTSKLRSYSQSSKSGHRYV